MRPLALTSLALLATAAAACGQPAPQTRPRPARTVRVTATGYNRDDALKQALRKALEQGAGLQIAAYSQVRNFALLRDTIYSRAAGIVSDYRVLEERPAADGTVLMTIQAVVRPSAVAAAWGAVQNVLDQVGRPRIMVSIAERIDGRLQQHSIVASRIEQMFVKAGFDLVAPAAAARPPRASDDQSAARLARQAGAHILIRGAANADRAGLENLYGVPTAFYNCDVQARVYYTHTGKLLASESLPVTRAGVRSRSAFSPQAARAALVKATFPPPGVTRRTPALALRLFEAVMELWSTQLTAAADIELEIENLDFKAFLDARRALRQLERVRSVDGDFTRGRASFRIKAQLSARTLAELLTRPPFAPWLEVVDLKPNRIRARAVGRP